MSTSKRFDESAWAIVNEMEMGVDLDAEQREWLFGKIRDEAHEWHGIGAHEAIEHAVDVFLGHLKSVLPAVEYERLCGLTLIALRDAALGRNR